MRIHLPATDRGFRWSAMMLAVLTANDWPAYARTLVGVICLITFGLCCLNYALSAWYSFMTRRQRGTVSFD